MFKAGIFSEARLNGHWTRTSRDVGTMIFVVSWFQLHCYCSSNLERLWHCGVGWVKKWLRIWNHAWLRIRAPPKHMKFQNGLIDWYITVDWGEGGRSVKWVGWRTGSYLESWSSQSTLWYYIFLTDLRSILLNFVTMDVCALFLLSFGKISCTKAKIRPLGHNRDFFGTMFGPFRYY